MAGAVDKTAMLQDLLDRTSWPEHRLKRVLAAVDHDGVVPGLRHQLHWSAADLQGLSMVEASTVQVCEELDLCYSRGLFMRPDDVPEHDALDGWTLFHFFMKRTLYEDNLADCATVARCLTELRKQVPIAGMWAAAMYAGTEIPLHSHPANTVVRVHLTLRSGDETALQVEDVVMPFVVGTPVIFQPCFEHQAWNRDPGGRDRLVLSIDFWHPDLTRYEVAALQFMDRA